MELTAWQRIRRRLSLMGGSYTHPDGHIELDFEEPAGINSRADSFEVQEAKLERWEQKKAARDRSSSHVAGAGFVGLGAYWFATEPIPMHHPIGTAMTVAFGLWLLRR